MFKTYILWSGIYTCAQIKHPGFTTSAIIHLFTRLVNVSPNSSPGSSLSLYYSSETGSQMLWLQTRCRDSTWFRKVPFLTLLCCFNPKRLGLHPFYTKFQVDPEDKIRPAASSERINRYFIQPLPCF